jgi:peptide/nickel transport system substrate-binding protein
VSARALLTAALAAALAACGPLAHDTSGSAAGRHPWTHAGIVRVGVADEPDSLDPLFANTASADQVSTLLYAHVFRYDYHGRLLPDLATVVPTYANGGISPDGRTITLHLRHGVRWADGAPLDGRDIVFTWQTVMNDRNAVRSRLGWSDVASMTLPDRYTLVVRMRRVNAAIIDTIFGGGGGTAFPPLPRHLLATLPDLNHADINVHPLSSGPFVLAEWAHGASLTFVPNPRYYRGRASITKLVWKVVPNAETLFQELQTHDIDLYDGVPEAEADRVSRLDGIAVQRRLVANWRHLDFNCRKPLLADVRVRRAIAQAVDWDGMNRTIYHGVNFRATSDIVPDSWAAPTIPAWRYDPVAAKRELDAAGWRPGPGGVRVRGGTPLALTISSGTNKPASEQAEVLMVAQLKAVGIALTIKNYPVSLLFAQHGPLYGGSYDLSWSTDTNGPEPDNSGIWSGRYIPPHGANTSFLDDPVITQTSEDALLTFDRARRKALYAREESRIHELVPTVFLYWERSTVAYNSDLKHYTAAEYDLAALWNAHEWEI